jgi:hypothetical protein
MSGPPRTGLATMQKRKFVFLSGQELWPPGLASPYKPYVLTVLCYPSSKSVSIKMKIKICKTYHWVHILISSNVNFCK